MTHGQKTVDESQAASGAPPRWAGLTGGCQGDLGKPLLQDDEIIAGRYRVSRFIARGGMGEVYEAFDLELDLPVAVKTIRAERASDARSIERLKREILAARRISHPNVVRVHDVGFHVLADQREVAFITMDLLGGETLDAYLRRVGRLCASEAAPLVEQMVAALESAHAAGVVHRDFKSQNVIVTEGAPGEPVRAVVTDFGLAEAGADSEGAAGSTREFVGTPGYMSPEQVSRRHPVTRSSDIYALGVVMFEMVTGRRPFEAESGLATAVRRLEEPAPPPRRYVRDLPPVWEATILRCLEREPGARFATAAEVMSALRGRPPSGLRWRRHGVLLALAAGLGVVSLRLAAPERPPAQAQIVETRAAPARRPPGLYTLSRPGSGKCLDVDGGGLADGTNIQLLTCDGSGAQVFRLEDRKDASQRLVNVASSKCVDVSGSGNADGTNIQLWTCNGTSAQSFLLEAAPDGTHRLRNTGSHKCVDVAPGPEVDRSNVQLSTCSVDAAQGWRLTPSQRPVEPSPHPTDAAARLELTAARLQVQAGRLDDGRESARRALGQARQIADLALEAEALLLLGRVEDVDGNLAAAEAFWKAAARTADTAGVGAARTRVEAWIELSGLYERQGRLAEASTLNDWARIAVHDVPDLLDDDRVPAARP